MIPQPGSIESHASATPGLCLPVHDSILEILELSFQAASCRCSGGNDEP